jgi:hypothetical protein
MKASACPAGALPVSFGCRMFWDSPSVLRCLSRRAANDASAEYMEDRRRDRDRGGSAVWDRASAWGRGESGRRACGREGWCRTRPVGAGNSRGAQIAGTADFRSNAGNFERGPAHLCGRAVGIRAAAAGVSRQEDARLGLRRRGCAAGRRDGLFQSGGDSRSRESGSIARITPARWSFWDARSDVIPTRIAFISAAASLT